MHPKQDYPLQRKIPRTHVISARPQKFLQTSFFLILNHCDERLIISPCLDKSIRKFRLAVKWCFIGGNTIGNVIGNVMEMFQFEICSVVISMLVTEVGDSLCWERNKILRGDFYIEQITNMMILAPTSLNCRQWRLAIIKSPTPL